MKKFANIKLMALQVILKIYYHHVGKYFWKKPGYYRVNNFLLYLNPKDGMSAWKRRFCIWEYELFSNLSSYVSKNEKILELGSCEGYTGLQLLSAAPKGRLVGIEPFPKYFKYLEKTLAKNRIPKETLNFLNIGYSLTSKSSIFYDDDNPYLSLKKLNGISYENAKLKSTKDRKKTKIQTFSLKQIIKKIDFTPTLLFMDIEGMERIVFKEMTKLNFYPKIIWEHHSVFYGAEVLYEILLSLEKKGYQNTKIGKEHYFSTVKH